jgi:hypothetical protein
VSGALRHHATAQLRHNKLTLAVKCADVLHLLEFESFLQQLPHFPEESGDFHWLLVSFVHDLGVESLQLMMKVVRSGKKNVVFWDVSPCGSCKNRRFGGTYRLYLQGKSNQLIKHVSIN